MTTPINTRERWLHTYENLEARGQAMKDSQSVAFGLLDIYDSLTEDQQKHLLPILAEWMLSDDNKHRYDAMFLARERKIVELVPAINKAITHLKQIPGPESENDVEGLIELRKILASPAG